MNLRDDIKYIKSGSLSNLYVNGEKADRISVTVMTVGQDGTISQEAVKLQEALHIRTVHLM